MGGKNVSAAIMIRLERWLLHCNPSMNASSNDVETLKKPVIEHIEINTTLIDFKNTSCVNAAIWLINNELVFAELFIVTNPCRVSAPCMTAIHTKYKMGGIMLPI